MQEVTLQIWESKIRRCQSDSQLRQTILKLTAQVLKEAAKVADAHKIHQVESSDHRYNTACREISAELQKQERKYLAAAEKLK